MFSYHDSMQNPIAVPKTAAVSKNEECSEK